MASSLSEKLSRLVKEMRGQARISESNVSDMLREVRMALLEADVALPVVRDFIARVKEKALGQEVTGLVVSPGQALVGIVNRELAATMGDGVSDHQPRCPAAGGDPDGGPAGLGQDHHHRQAGQAT
jgi:signal recognition particle subunit SRP54